MKRKKMISLIMLSIMIGQVESNAFRPNCPPGHGKEGPMRFTEDPGKLAITCERAYVELACCIQGYEFLSWFSNTSSGWKEIEQNPTDKYYQPNDNNQTLTLLMPLQADEGSYKCVAEDNNGTTLNNTFTLELRECPQLVTPKMILPETNKTIVRHQGADVVLECLGYVGADHQKTLSRIIWTVTANKSQGKSTSKFWHKIDTPKSTNINVTFSESVAHMMSTIRISGITEEEYGNYTCVMLNVVKTIRRTFELVPPDLSTSAGITWKNVSINLFAVVTFTTILLAFEII